MTLTDAPFDGLTMVIPTYDEAENIPALYAALAQYVPGARIIIVDDSPNDETVGASSACGPSYLMELDIHCEHRPEDRRIGGLSGAVCDGFNLAKPESIVGVCDADLQHPLDTIPAMLAVMRSSGADLVIASRYASGGSASGLDGPLRHAVSRACTWLAKVLFPMRLHSVSDPMSGCFMVRRSCVDTDRLQADGFKILLELLVAHNLSHAEVPLQFAARVKGSSKGDVKNGLKFLRQLLRLRLSFPGQVSGQV